jgi:hypothetical protein
MEKMIDKMIEIGQPEVALRMKFVQLAYDQNGDVDVAFEAIFKLQKEC